MGKTHKSHKNAKGPTPQLRSRTTRSSKGRLLTETSSSTAQLTTQLSLLGLYASPTIGDGNCLFRALSDQLYGSPSKHKELRQQICNHIAEYKSRYEPFVEDDRGLDEHLRAMRENATYGGHLELSAFAHMARRNVKVIQPGLVYVIQWDAGGWEEGTARPSAGEQGELSTTPRRTPRRSTKSVSPTRAKEVKEETRIKLGRGYYVYEEVSSDDEGDTAKVKVEEVEDTLQGTDPTVYVAYHDWEHFSSIRNLRGPHTGPPNIVETPAPSVEDPEQITGREREKGRDRERKKEKEREKKGKEKEKEKDAEVGTSSGALKVKLKLRPSASPNANASVFANGGPLPSSSSSTPASSSISDSQSQYDPSLIPLPISRSSSPFIGSSSSLVPSSAASPLPSSSLANEVYPEDPAANAHISTPEGLGHGYRHLHGHILQTPRTQYRSPKRTFDESSASGGEDDPENSKRSRRRVGSAGWPGTGTDGTTDVSIVGKPVEGEKNGVVDIAMHVVVDGKGNEAVTPSRDSSSSPLSSVASSVASSVSGALSDVDVDDGVDLESQAGEPNNEVTIGPASPLVPPSSLIIPDGLSKKARQRYLHVHHHRGHHPGVKPLTRRQRKALGLPKARKGVASTIGSSNGPTCLSAGKITIPGGKWKGGDGAAVALPGVVDSQANEEWRRNGTGRLDVRGFRELKI